MSCIVLTARKLNLLLLTTLALLILGCSSSENPKVPLKEVPSRLANKEAEISIYNAAMNAYDKGIYSVALRHIKLFKDSYPLSKLTPSIVLKEADTKFYSGQFTEAAAVYQEFIRNYPTHDGNSYAQFMLGRTHLEQYKDAMRDQEPLNLAIKNFENLRKNYPGSELNSQVRKYMLEIVEQQAHHELNVAKYYIEAGALEPAAGRVAIIRTNYSESSANEELKLLLTELDIDNRLKLLALSETIPVKPLDQKILDFLTGPIELASNSAPQPRFRLEEEDSTNLQVANKNADKFDEDLLGDLSCSRIGEWSVFSVNLSNFDNYSVLVKGDSKQTDENSIFTSRLSFKNEDFNESEVVNSKTCTIAEKKILLRETRTTSGESVVDVGIISPGKLELEQTETIVLDRPHRLITLIHSP